MAESKRSKSFIIGGILVAVAIGLGISAGVKNGNFLDFLAWFIVGVFAFTFSSCLVLDNNVVGDVFLGILEWGFVKMPGVIFTLDLDGIIWLITVKLLFWVLGIILALICGILGFIVSCVVSVFVYPFAIYKNVKYSE